MPTAQHLLERVVEPGYCIGCGACAALAESPLRMEMDSTGRYVPRIRDGGDAGHEGAYLEVCPFAAETDEDELAARFVAGPQSRHDPEIGSFRSLFAGHAQVGNFRRDGSSGGITTWFLAKLFEDDLVDAVLHVHPDGTSDRLFGYQVSSSLAETARNSRTRYYPVEMSKVLQHVRTHPGRYAVVGVPCFLKAVRLLQSQDPVFAERVAYCVGIVCGHLKSTNFAASMGWQLGVDPDALEAISFREKNDVSADGYDVTVTDARSGETTRARASSLMVQDWGMGLFKYHACDFCDDVLAETADISMGDAWLPGYTKDPMGANVVVTRSEQAQRVLDAHREELELDELSPEAVRQSQAAGLRHRREGLAHRLAVADAQGVSRPIKRVQPDAALPRNRQHIYEIRSRFIEAGDRAFAQAHRVDDFGEFQRALAPMIQQYREAYVSQWPVRAWVKKRLPRVFQAVRQARRRLLRL